MLRKEKGGGSPIPAKKKKVPPCRDPREKREKTTSKKSGILSERRENLNPRKVGNQGVEGPFRAKDLLQSKNTTGKGRAVGIGREGKGGEGRRFCGFEGRGPLSSPRLKK